MREYLDSLPEGLYYCSFRFEDENKYEYDSQLNVFACVLKDTPESFILLFFTKKVSRVVYTEEG